MSPKRRFPNLNLNEGTYESLAFHLLQLSIFYEEQEVGTAEAPEWDSLLRQEVRRMSILGDREQVQKELRDISPEQFRDLAERMCDHILTQEGAADIAGQLRQAWMEE